MATIPDTQYQRPIDTDTDTNYRYRKLRHSCGDILYSSVSSTPSLSVHSSDSLTFVVRTSNWCEAGSSMSTTSTYSHWRQHHNCRFVSDCQEWAKQPLAAIGAWWGMEASMDAKGGWIGREGECVEAEEEWSPVILPSSSTLSVNHVPWLFQCLDWTFLFG